MVALVGHPIWVVVDVRMIKLVRSTVRCVVSGGQVIIVRRLTRLIMGELSASFIVVVVFMVGAVAGTTIVIALVAVVVLIARVNGIVGG